MTIQRTIFVALCATLSLATCAVADENTPPAAPPASSPATGVSADKPAGDDAQGKEVQPDTAAREVPPAEGTDSDRAGDTSSSSDDADSQQYGDSPLTGGADEAGDGSSTDEDIDIDVDSDSGDSDSVDEIIDDNFDLGEEGSGDEGDIDLGSGDVDADALAAAGAPAAAVESVITSDEIEQSGTDNIGDLLAQEAGFTVTDSFSGAEISFQGLPSKFSTILIDGQRVPGRIAERIDSGQLPLSNIDHIEILRGPQAAAYGSESAGVIINIITRKAGTRRAETGSAAAESGSSHSKLESLPNDAVEVCVPDVTGSTTLEAGSFGYSRQQIDLQSGDNSGGWYLSAERKQRDKYDLNSSFPDTDGDGFKQYDFFGKYQGQLGKDNYALQLDWYTSDALGLSFSPPDQIRDNATKTRRLQGSAAYTWDLRHGRSLSLSQSYGSYYHNLDRFYVDFPEQTLTSTGFRDELADTHLGYQQYGKDYLITAGAERNFDRLASDRIKGAQDGARGTATAEILAGYVSYEWLGGKRLSYSLAARYDHHDFFGGEFTPKAAAQYKLGQHTTLSAGVGRGYRAPSLRERFYEFASPFGYSVIGNENLAAETSTSYDAGLRWDYRLRSLELSAFRHDISNLIVFSEIQAVPQVFQTQNVANALSSGLSLSASQRWRAGGSAECHDERWFSGKLDGTWIAQSRDSELGTRLPGSPDLDLSLRLGYDWGHTGLSSLLRYSGSRFLDRENLSEAPAFTTLDLGWKHQCGHGTWQLNALNVTDEKDGRYGPEPGREIRLGYTLEF